MTTEDIVLPGEFRERMTKTLGDECDEFFRSYEKKRRASLRLNHLVLPEDGDMRNTVDGRLREMISDRVPWTGSGFYVREGVRPGRHVYHEAGAYYMQEASAMAVAAFAGIKKGEAVLDLCAAPGGKSTAAADMLGGTGLLVSNEYVPLRAGILSGNIERMGIPNAVVTNMGADDICARFQGFFDTVIVDAPCSGEGMFLRKEEAIPDWSPDKVRQMASLQREILQAAAMAVKPGGRLVYSTCTFSEDENEDNTEWFLGGHPEFEEEEILTPERMEMGIVPGRGGHGARLYPHRLEGEGHYIAKFRKKGSGSPFREVFGKRGRKEKEAETLFKIFANETLTEEAAKWCLGGEWMMFGDEIYRMPTGFPVEGIRTLRAGVDLGTVKKGRFEPAHHLARTLGAKGFQPGKMISLDSEDARAARFIAGEAIQTDLPAKGWCLVSADGLPMGWGKVSGGTVKNHYPKGLRRCLG